MGVGARAGVMGKTGKGHEMKDEAGRQYQAGVGAKLTVDGAEVSEPEEVLAARRLVTAHWEGYVEPLLKQHGVTGEEMRVAKFHYMSAGVHFYGHGVEDERDRRSGAVIEYSVPRDTSFLAGFSLLVVAAVSSAATVAVMMALASTAG